MYGIDYFMGEPVASPEPHSSNVHITMSYQLLSFTDKQIAHYRSALKTNELSNSDGYDITLDADLVHIYDFGCDDHKE